MLFDDQATSQVFQQIQPEVVSLSDEVAAVSVHGSSLSLALRACIDVAQQSSHVAINDVLQLFVIDVVTCLFLLVQTSKSIPPCRLSELGQLCLHGSRLIAGNLAENCLLDDSLCLHQPGSCRQQGAKTPLGRKHIRIALRIGRASNNLVVLEGDVRANPR